LPAENSETIMSDIGSLATRQTNDLDAFWLPFTPNRAFKRAPRLITSAKGMHYFTPDGRAVLECRPQP
jgi:beta-alanine--pyruvate transaminase